MFNRNSRYFNLPVSTITVTRPDGEPVEIRYVQRRFLPPVAGETLLQEHPFADKERLDIITARYLDDPTLFWRLCDSNLVMQPEELERIGRRIRITLPGI